MLTKNQIKILLKEKNLKAVKKLGQNFLISEKSLEKIIQASEISNKDEIIEIGPGFGTLTKELAKKCKRVVAIEKDKKMAELLKLQMLSWNHNSKKHDGKCSNRNHCIDNYDNKRNKCNVEIIAEDALKINISDFLEKYIKSKNKKYKLVSNIPYYITSQIIKIFLEKSDIQPSLIVILVQKEVAERICASKGKMSILALSVQAYGNPKIIDFVDKSSFYPKPKVDSAILKIENIKRDFSKNYYKELFRIIKIGFSARRKKLENNLVNGLRIEKNKCKEIIALSDINKNARPQELGLKDWKKLCAVYHWWFHIE